MPNMRKILPGYYNPTSSDFEDIWNRAHIVLDTNALLRLYQYRTETRDDFMRVMNQLRERLWMPHQIAYEFQENRLAKLDGQLEPFRKLDTILNKTQSEILSVLKATQIHAFADTSQIEAKMIESFDTLRQEWQSQEILSSEFVKNCKEHDNIRELIDRYYEDRIGIPFSIDELTNLYTEAESRYAERIPPGFKDSQKNSQDPYDKRKYGDFLIWMQMIEHAKSSGLPIIFVTEDMKEDWWQVENGKHGQHPALINEMHSKAGVPLYMYSSLEFVKHANTFLNTEARATAIEELQRIQIENDQNPYLEDILQSSDHHTWYADIIPQIEMPGTALAMQTANNLAETLSSDSKRLVEQIFEAERRKTQEIVRSLFWSHLPKNWWEK